MTVKHNGSTVPVAGDVPTTYADATALERDFGFTPENPENQGDKNQGDRNFHTLTIHQ